MVTINRYLANQMRIKLLIRLIPTGTPLKKLLTISVALLSLISTVAFSQAINDLPMDRVYQGPIQLPDFTGRDRAYLTYRTKITNEMKTGPNFAGHYAIIEIGCGTSCRFAFIGDVVTGQVFSVPYSGENYYMLQLQYGVKSNYVSAHWVENDACYSDFISWNGKEFLGSEKRVVGPKEKCE